METSAHVSTKAVEEHERENEDRDDDSESENDDSFDDIRELEFTSDSD